MKNAAVALFLLGCGSQPPPAPGPTASPTAVAPTPEASKAKVDHDAPKGEIVTAEIEKMNSAEFGRPPVKFNKGHVSARKPAPTTKTANGFQVQFASHATITTPTVYERSVIVSGGFKSKELYAYEAQSGKPMWAIDLHDDGPSSPACESETCVISTESCTIFALEAKTGKMKWSYWLGDPLTSAPTIAKNRVFASYPAAGTSDPKKPRPPGASHALAAFELQSGKILWQLWLDSDVMSAPVAVDEFVYVTTFKGTVIKLEQATGKVRYAMRAKATSAPVIQFDKAGVEQMYYTRRGESEAADAPAEEMIIRADHNDPKTKYKAAKKRADYIDSKVQDKTDHAKTAKEQDAANGFSGGAPASANAGEAYQSVGVTSVSSMQNFQGSRIVKLRDRSVNTMGDEVIATDAETGNTLWKHKLPGDLAKQGGFLGTAPLAAGNSIMFGTLDGSIHRLDQQSGKELAKWSVGAKVRSQPVVESGWIYVGTEDGKLVAIDTKDPTVTGWPTWGGNAQRTGIAK
ncbi:MAG: PQQ-binding-like beta-propeller repeat protein [Deltaproteobacteria bacterium]|nr:PQQ-binding-like beta-propeller repeat protein [Deltaproteobacteria bacterium]